MKRILKLLILFISLSYCLEGCKSEKSEGDELNKSILTAKLPKQILGSIAKKETPKVPFTFTVLNPSDKDINIEATDVSCECIHITESPKQVSAHSYSKIKGFIDTKLQIGHISKSIFVRHEKDYILLLRIVADIKE